ncbi:glutamate--tRNA ligase [Rubrobacter radiotolerans]|uniref:Glutamate--tRNA ligase n=1 Tax=Rubrobacter radiotolerans TaxID=42256 RepID=A0A023X6F0_RUBRA|nr:glutamate--tRNA ligase [Rubrobacter radiotolerans]AHY47550.1 glutamate--tRNA ligase [Rubrobacter radiotolerans]MDX5894953.1 glutamate--tRNA ligase [Rubrobacter radiotolerans]SMC07143.1 glutamyl-tRNA synthetase [Rubrobacter radiotolerans DSM 5868]
MTDSQVRVRYAPSPTGTLHVGGVRTALFNWLFARKNGGTFVLRIEDTDLERSTEESVEQLKSSLRWIGLDWDEGPEVGGPHEPYRQTERLDLYREAAQRLLDEGKAYYDFATPEELAELRRQAQAEKRAPIYTGGEYREMDLEEALRRVEAGEAHTVRFKTPRNGETTFTDMIRGEISFENKNLEDFVIMKSSGTPTYNFAAAVDDATMRITHVIRGDDHISNTPRQILIYKALGYPVPPFAHVPQVLGPDKKKLSKRHGAASAEEFAEQGVLPEALFNYLALLGAGYAADEEIFSPDELARRFRIEKVSGNPAVFDETKLLAVNATYLRRKSPEELAMLAAPALAESGVASADELERDMGRLTEIMALLRERLQRTTDIPDAASYFYGDELDYDEEEFEKQFGKPFVRENFSEMVARLKALDRWDDETLEATIRGFAEEKEKGARHIIHPLRFAATGRTVSAGLFETLALLGKERTIKRLEAAERKRATLAV